MILLTLNRELLMVFPKYWKSVLVVIWLTFLLQIFCQICTHLKYFPRCLKHCRYSIDAPFDRTSAYISAWSYKHPCIPCQRSQEHHSLGAKCHFWTEVCTIWCIVVFSGFWLWKGSRSIIHRVTLCHPWGIWEIQDGRQHVRQSRKWLYLIWFLA